MGESRRMYQRRKASITITVSPDDFPIVASPIQALPVSPMGFVTKSSYDAALKNTSTDGFCFVTQKKIEPGTEIDINMMPAPSLHDDDQSPVEYHAIVLWCKPLDSGKEASYEIGAKRIRDHHLPILNWRSLDFASMKCV